MEILDYHTGDVRTNNQAKLCKLHVVENSLSPNLCNVDDRRSRNERLYIKELSKLGGGERKTWIYGR